MRRSQVEAPLFGRAPAANVDRQDAQRSFPSCSVTHSRQKNLLQEGQRATASRNPWVKQRCCASEGPVWLIVIQQAGGRRLLLPVMSEGIPVAALPDAALL